MVTAGYSKAVVKFNYSREGERKKYWDMLPDLVSKVYSYGSNAVVSYFCQVATNLVGWLNDDITKEFPPSDCGSLKLTSKNYKKWSIEDLDYNKFTRKIQTRKSKGRWKLHNNMKEAMKNAGMTQFGDTVTGYC